jgi:nucleotide-binding universal stress UspA family protein
MYKNMLVPVDGSRLAESAFAYARELASRLGANVTVLHVVDPTESESLPMHQAYASHSAEMVRRRVYDVQRKLGKKPGSEVPQIAGEVVMGHAPDEILRYAREKGIDLMVMSTHGRTGVRRWVLGSVADEVLRHSTVPVLLVRPETADTAKLEKWTDITVIVPLDGSPLAESVLPHVQALARQVGNEMLNVVLVMVCEPPPTPPVAGPEIPFDWQKLMDENWAACRRTTLQYLAGIEKHLKETGLQVRSEPLEQLKASAAEEIVDYANKVPFSLIVMATHGRTGVSRWAYGSVAQKVLTGSSSPILMVRPAAAGAEAAPPAKDMAGRRA